MTHDELEELKSKLREYDSAARDLANITQLGAHIDDLKGKLVRSQELVASYQVCTRFYCTYAIYKAGKAQKVSGLCTNDLITYNQFLASDKLAF